MKKYLGITLFISIIMLMSSCKKESEEAQLSAQMSDFSTPKAYLDTNRYTCFILDEKVRVNNSEGNIASLSDNDRHCNISGVSEAEGYYAFYPASMVKTADLSNGFNNVTVELPMAQLYHQTGSGKQIIENPMAAHLAASSGLLQFHNLCALLKVSVKGACNLNAIQVTTSTDVPLWGNGEVKDIDGKPYLEMSEGQTGHNTITLYFEDSRSIGDGEEASFYIVVPQTVLASESKLKVDVIADEVYDNNDNIVYHHPYQKTLSQASTIAANSLNTLGCFDLTTCITHQEVFHPYSVASNKIIVFSRGNLQYNPSQHKYRMALHPYDYIGSQTGNNDYHGTVSGSDNRAFFMDSANYTGWIDLFCWGTGNIPTAIGRTTNTYSEWGDNVFNRAERNWYTMTSSEWTYLINNRNAARVGSTVNARYVKTHIEGSFGVLLFPDDFSCPAGISFTQINSQSTTWDQMDSLTMEQYAVLECAGCTFLPAAGERVVRDTGVVVGNCNAFGRYWASNLYRTKGAYNCWLGGSVENRQIDPASYHPIKEFAYSVRLVYEK